MNDFSKDQYAIVKLPNGEVLEGPCKDFKTDRPGGCIVTIKGVGLVYTHISNIAITCNLKEEKDDG